MTYGSCLLVIKKEAVTFIQPPMTRLNYVTASHSARDTAARMEGEVWIEMGVSVDKNSGDMDIENDNYRVIDVWDSENISFMRKDTDD